MVARQACWKNKKHLQMTHCKKVEKNWTTSNARFEKIIATCSITLESFNDDAMANFEHDKPMRTFATLIHIQNVVNLLHIPLHPWDMFHSATNLHAPLHLWNVFENAMNIFSNFLPGNVLHYHPSFQKQYKFISHPLCFQTNFVVNRCQWLCNCEVFMNVNLEKSLRLVMVRRKFWIVDCEHKGDAINKSTVAKICHKVLQRNWSCLPFQMLQKHFQTSPPWCCTSFLPNGNVNPPCQMSFLQTISKNQIFWIPFAIFYSRAIFTINVVSNFPPTQFLNNILFIVFAWGFHQNFQFSIFLKFSKVIWLSNFGVQFFIQLFFGQCYIFLFF